jgi:hypothetical protein
MADIFTARKRLSGFDWDAIDRRNQQNVKNTPDGGQVPVLACMELVLIGPGHPDEYVEAAREGNAYEGMITVDKGGMLDRGELHVTGINSNRAQFQDAIAQFSKKKVIYH